MLYASYLLPRAYFHTKNRNDSGQYCGSYGVANFAKLTGMLKQQSTIYGANLPCNFLACKLAKKQTKNPTFLLGVSIEIGGNCRPTVPFGTIASATMMVTQAS